MTLEITGKSAEVTVGQKIKLGINFTNEWGILKDIKWKIPGTIVKDYTDGQLKANVTRIKSDDKKKRTIDFYWVDGEDGRTVKADCRFTANGKTLTKTISATFDVKAPVMDKLSAVCDIVRLLPTAANPDRVSFGDPYNKVGIEWDWKVTVPGTHDGFLKDMQTIKIDNKKTEISGDKFVRTISGKKVSSPDFHLDTDNPYSLKDDFPPCPGFPFKVTAGGSFTDTSTSDTPSNSLGGTKYITIDRFFVYYLMYKPDTPGAIWVPIGKAEWNCIGEAKLNSTTNVWSLHGQGGGITSAGAVTKDFPVYYNNSRYLGYEPM